MNLKNRKPSSDLARIGIAFFSAVLAPAGSGAGKDSEPPPLIARPLETSAPVETGKAANPTPRSAVEAVPIKVPAEASPAGPRAPAHFSSKKSLREFLGDNDSLALRNATDFRQLRIPVPWRAKWPEMRVDLRYQNSGALIPERSQMELWWAGGMVTQKALDGGQPDRGLLAEIPNRQMRPGAHVLELRALHRTAAECDDPFGEELWTQIDPAESALTLNYQLRSLSPVLADIPRLIDRYRWEPYRFRLVTAEPWALTEIHLEWMSRVTERVALLLGSVPMEVTHASALEASGDQLVIGLREEILPMLPESIAIEITDSFAGIFPNPRDDRFFVAVIAGGSREGIEKAVRAFTATEFDLPPDPVLDLTGVTLPGPPPPPSSPALRPGEERSFAELGGRTWDLQGLSTGRAGLPVHFSPGVNPASSANLRLKLRMAWSPVRRDATIDIFVNGSREATIPIGKAGVERFDDYEMDLPLRSFRPGENRIAFQPNLIPPNVGECRPVNWENLRFVLREDSRLKFPEVDREIRLPDLELTARCAVPAANLDSGTNRQSFTIFMGERESAGISAGCTLLGKFVQTAGRRIPKTRLSFQDPPEDSNYLAMGPGESLPSALFPGGARLEPGKSDAALLAQFRSPLNDDRVGMIMAVSPDADVAECVRQLIQPERWDRMAGDTVSWGGAGSESLTVRPGQFESLAVYHDARAEGRNGSGFSPGWILYPAALLLLIGGGVTLYLRRNRARDSLPGRVSIDSPMWSLGGEDRI